MTWEVDPGLAGALLILQLTAGNAQPTGSYDDQLEADVGTYNYNSSIARVPQVLTMMLKEQAASMHFESTAGAEAHSR